MNEAVNRATAAEEAVRRALNTAMTGNALAGLRPDGAVMAEPPQFVGLSEKLAESLVESAQAQFNFAEQKLKEAQLFAEQLREEVRRRADSIQDLKVRLEDFGSSVLNAHQKFHSTMPGPGINQAAQALNGGDRR